MKFFAKLMLAVLLIAIALPFTLLKGKDGAPLMSIDKVKMPELAMPEMPDLDFSLPGNKPEPDTVYKWQDAQGIWQFSSTPPPQGTGYTVQTYDPNANQIQAVEASKGITTPAQQKNQETPKPTDVYSPGGVKQLIENAQQLQQTLNERNQQQQQLLQR